MGKGVGTTVGEHVGLNLYVGMGVLDESMGGNMWVSVRLVSCECNCEYIVSLLLVGCCIMLLCVFEVANVGGD